jgi:hypothetical protein
MGANTFETVSKGATASAAFDAAVAQAKYDHGHGGYSWTIAEKGDYRMLVCPAGEEPRKFASRLIDEGDPRVDDKWGPAGCVDLGGGKWLFFGWASS